MGKSINLNVVDRKLANILSVVKDASAEMLAAAESIEDLVKKVSESMAKINSEMQETLAQETDTEEAAQAKATADFGGSVAPDLRRITSRIERLAKNNKAVSGLLAAAKALHQDPDENE